MNHMTLQLPTFPSAGTLDCPMHNAMKLIAHKWTALIIYHLSLSNDALRFRQLQRRLNRITQKELTQRLRELESRGMVRRRVYAEVPPRVDYHLTESGASLVPLLVSMAEWAKKHDYLVEKPESSRSPAA